MKILVFSDSHGNSSEMRHAIRSNKDADVVMFCGDGHHDLIEMQQDFPDKAYFAVKGNCDWYCDFALVQTVTLCGKKILLTHGHAHSVKEGLTRLVCFAHQEQADILLFGHTHQQMTTADGRMLIMNPGSVGFHEEYGVITIDEATGKITAVEYPHNQYGPVVIS